MSYIESLQNSSTIITVAYLIVLHFKKMLALSDSGSGSRSSGGSKKRRKLLGFGFSGGVFSGGIYIFGGGEVIRWHT